MLSKDKKRIHVSLPNRTYNALMEEKNTLEDGENYHWISNVVNKLLEINYGIADDGDVINYIHFLQDEYNV